MLSIYGSLSAFLGSLRAPSRGTGARNPLLGAGSKGIYLALGFLLPWGVAQAQSGTCPVYSWGYVPPTGQVWCAGNCFAELAPNNFNNPALTYTPSGSCDTPPTGAGQTCNENVQECGDFHGDGQTECIQTGYSATSGQSGTKSCAGNCTQGQTQDLLATIAADNGSTPVGTYCANGCAYSNGNTSLLIGSQSNRYAGLAVNTGQTCGSANATSTTSGGCFTHAGETICGNDSLQAGTVNGDLVSPANAPASGQCVAFASGGVMCTVPGSVPAGATPQAVAADMASATPPAPDSGTAGTPAVPAVVAQLGASTVAYYTAAQVNSSAGAVGTGPVTGSGSSSGGGSSSSSSGGGHPGDCDQSATDSALCNGTLPSLTRNDTVQSDIQTYMAAVNSAPIVAAVSGVASASYAPGSCPSETFTLTYLGGKTFDLMSAPCQIFATVQSALTQISDALWCLLGIVIVMSA